MFRSGFWGRGRRHSGGLTVRGAGRMFGIALVVMSSGCDGVDDVPTKPSPGLGVEPVTTSTQLETIAIRVDVAARVVMGATQFAEAVEAGRGRAEVCVDGNCASETVRTREREVGCEVAVGVNQVEIADAWFAADVTGIEFCVPTQTTSESYEITLSYEQTTSNPITTSCGISGAFLECTSE